MSEFPAPQSLVGMMLVALGSYGILISLAATIAFGLALILVIRGRGPFVGVAVQLIAPFPLYVAMIGATHRGISTMHALAISDDPSPNGINQALLIVLFFPAYGLISIIPSYGVAVLGTLIRGLSEKESG